MTQNERDIHYPLEPEQHPEPEETSGMKALKRFRHAERFDKANFMTKCFHSRPDRRD